MQTSLTSASVFVLLACESSADFVSPGRFRSDSRVLDAPSAMPPVTPAPTAKTPVATSPTHA